MKEMVTDNHMHLDRRGLYLEAVKQFQRAGGSRIILVQKPTFPQDIEGFIRAFEETISMCEEAKKLVECYPVIGVHPAEFDRLFNSGKKEVCFAVLDVIEEYVEEKKVVGIGEFGRPHYPVSDETQREAHVFMVEALERSRSLGCPIQLHTESLDLSGIEELETLTEKLGCKKVIKHFSSPLLTPYRQVVPSVIASESNIEKALSFDKPFLMETDYIDDPQRPGAVLGPKTVPKTVAKLLEKGVLTQERVDCLEGKIGALYHLEV